MIQTIRNAFTIPDLRKKILYTILIVFIFRIGTAIPVPFIDAEALRSMMENITQPNGTDTGNIISYLNMLSGRAFENATIFAMGIGPYITAQIIIQLLTVAIPPLEKLAKEGSEGRKKLNNIIRATTIGLGVFQGAMYYLMLKSSNAVFTYDSKWVNTFVTVFVITCFCAGTALVMWLGEQINKKGIGNGISILLFTGIVASGPKVFNTFRVWWELAREGSKGYYFAIPGLSIAFLCVIWFIVFMQNSERKVPVQYAKRVQGRKMVGGQKTFIPIKVNMSGVMPIIFASTIISVPATVKMLVYRGKTANTFWYKVWSVFDSNSLLYAFIYFLLIIAFAYFYVTIQYNPIEIANNLHKNNGAIPGIRPGKNTIAYLSKIINRITLIGALFLSVIAVLPIVISSFTNINISFGGTSVLILVGVALETVSQIESQMLMRHYKGFLD
ncbi:MAG: preprotein translocase subunit SecY [Oscillospiraceae bacterium]|nr:preprotein translocase subunit SecY [Oscillospiraceae bacterium]